MMARPALLILLLLLEGCGGIRLRALPDPAGQLDPEHQAISKRLAEVEVTIQAKAWQYRPRRLTDRFLPFLIRTVNHGRGDVTIRLADVGLIDDQGRTRRPLRPEEVVSLLLGGSDASALVPSAGIEASGPEPTIFGVELGLEWGRYRELRDIQRLAFPPEPIPSGSRAEGFVYFPNPPPDARRLTLLLILDAPSGQHQLPFVYAIDH
jgi:hypothetical protein